MKPSLEIYIMRGGSFQDWCEANDKTYLLDEWLIEDNSGVKPNQVTPGTNQEAYWECSVCGHVWIASPKTRKDGHGCPECKKKTLSKKRLSAALKLGQSLEEWCVANKRLKLLEEWSPDNPCSPREVTYGSSRLFLWVCNICDTSWSASPSSRTGRGDGCPSCAGKRVNSSNHIIAIYPHLAKEWHFEKNDGVLPEAICANSHRKVWWRCSKGHEWLASPNSRRKSGCPICAGKQVLEGFNDLATINPGLAAQWNVGKNELLPCEVTTYSNRLIWWVCEKGHEWKATVASRSSGNGCPICSNKTLCEGENDLGTVYPTLAKQLSAKNTLTASQIIAGSNMQAIWVCENGHEWRAAVSDRIRGHGCPICQNRKLLTGYNDLATRYPEVASEWNRERNSGKSPEEVIFSSNRHYYWTCSQGHEWSATVKSRTQNKTGCPECSAYTQTSFPQEAVFYYVSKVFNALSREKLLGKEIDVFLVDYKIGIEYDGKWHSSEDAIERDVAKNATMKKAGIPLYRIVESSDYCADRNSRCIKYRYSNDCRSLNKPITILLQWLAEDTNVDCGKIDVDCVRDCRSIDIQMNRGILANSFGERSRKYLPEWHRSRNRGLTPFQFSAFSKKRVWWKCSYCGREWEASFADRSYSKGLGCPLCSVRRSADNRCKKVVQFDLEGNVIRKWGSAKEAILATGIKTIPSACRGGQKTAGGYKWRYLSIE